MPVNVSVERDYNPDIVISRWGRFSDRLTQKIRSEVSDYLRFYGLENIKRYFPKGGRGILENSLRVFDESESYRIIFKIASENREYGEIIKILEYGSPAHTITPNQAKALSFRPHLMRFHMGFKGAVPMIIWGERIARARVEHPGNIAYRMFQQGLQDLKPELMEVVREAVRNEINDIVKER